MENQIAGAAAVRLFFLTVVAIAIATRPFKFHEISVSITSSSFVSSIHSFDRSTAAIVLSTAATVLGALAKVLSAGAIVYWVASKVRSFAATFLIKAATVLISAAAVLSTGATLLSTAATVLGAPAKSSERGCYISELGQHCCPSSELGFFRARKTAFTVLKRSES